MSSTTALVTYQSGYQVQRVFNNVGNAGALQEQLQAAARTTDGLLGVGTVDGHDAVINVHRVIDVQAQTYNP